MKQLIKEVDANFVRFSKEWRTTLEAVNTALQAHEGQYQESYRRLVSLQAWRVDLLEPHLSPESLAFFVEAQNDALVSHVLARLGSWRSSLKSLRSLIENVCLCLYYKDHPVELRLWRIGRHSVSFAVIYEYLQKHPALYSVQPAVAGLDVLKREYSTLSRAVHASAAGFRMAADGTGVRLWLSDKARVGGWQTRETATLTGVNLLMLAMFREELQGTKASNLRKAVSLGVPSGKHKEVKDVLRISLFSP